MLRHRMPLPLRTAPLLCAFLFATSTVMAQTEKPASTAEERPALERLRYNPKQQGPLLFIADTSGVIYSPYAMNSYWRDDAPVDGKTPAQFAEQTRRRIVTEGNITAVVPRLMTEIITNPGPPDPYAGLNIEERFLILLGTFTREQWKIAGSASGIGKNDLNEKQRAVLGGIIWGDALKVNTLLPTESGYRYSDQVDTVAADAVRLRLSRRVILRLKPLTEDGEGYTVEPDSNRANSDGSSPVRYTLEFPKAPKEGGNEGVWSAFGVPIIKNVPNRLKTGQLPLDAPALGVGMHLDGSHKTLGELLAAAGAASRLRLVADKRIASLPVQYRIAPEGHTVAVGDLLKVMCRSVTGTFRRLDGPGGETIYLLTDDVEGIGTRFARLNRWAEKAFFIAHNATSEATRNSAENEPLDALKFAPDYPYALPDDLLKSVDESYRSSTWGDGPDVAVSRLPPALRQEFREGLDNARKQAKSALRSDRVGLDTLIQCAWVLPDGRVAPMGFDGRLGLDFIRSVATTKASPPARNQAWNKYPIPTKLPAALKRRIVSLSLPETESETDALFALLKRKGFNEVWLRAEDDTPATVRRIQETVARGTKADFRVGVVIPWLGKGGEETGATPDVNIIGETGAGLAEYRLKRLSEKTPSAKYRAEYMDQFAGWVVPEANNVPSIVTRLSPFVKISRLSAVALSNSTALGYRIITQPGLGYASDEYMGYSAFLRFRCVVERGFDPVDIAPRTYYLRISPDLPFFLQREPQQKPLEEYRASQGKAHLARIHAAIKTAFPATPFLLGENQNRSFGFYGRWEKPGGLFESGQWDDLNVKKLRDVAFRAAPAQAPPVFAFRGGLPEYADAFFWNAWHDATEEAAKGWAGFCLNMDTAAPADTIALLSRLPDDIPSK